MSSPVLSLCSATNTVTSCNTNKRSPLAFGSDISDLSPNINLLKQQPQYVGQEMSILLHTKN